MGKKINEATSTDLPVILRLINEYGWKIEDTLLYQQQYDLPEELIKVYLKPYIKPDIVLQDLNGEIVAVIEEIDEKEIFGNPIYERLIGSYDSINKKFDGRFHVVINDLKNTFRGRPNA